MSITFTLAWKDFRLFLVNPLFFIIAMACTVLWSFTYLRNLFGFISRSAMAGGPMGGAAEQMNVHATVFLSHISYTNLLFIAVVPALTMRLLAEEKKLRTYDLLLTAPVSATQIALGKFLAGFGAVAALIAISMIYPLSTRILGEFSLVPLLTSYLGLLLVGGVYVAIGLFASSLTESVVLAVVIGWILNLTLWFISQGADFSDNTLFSGIMEHLSFGQHFMTFVKGSLQVSSIVFFVTCIGLFVFFTQRVIESARWR